MSGQNVEKRAARDGSSVQMQPASVAGAPHAMDASFAQDAPHAKAAAAGASVGSDQPHAVDGSPAQAFAAHPLWSVFCQVVRRFPGLFALLVVIIVVSVAASLLPPRVLGAVVDDLAANAGARTPGLAFLFLGLVALEGVSTAGREAVIVRFGQKVTHAVRSRMAEKLDTLPFAYFVDHAAGDLTSRFVNDVNTVESLFADGIISMVADVASVVGIVAIVFTESRGLGLLLLVTLPILFWFTRRVQHGMLGAQVDNRAAVAEANRQIPETLASFRTIKVLGCQPFMRRRYDRAIVRGFDAMERSNFYDAVYSPVILTCGAVVVAVMMTLSAQGGATAALFGMTVGTAVANIAYVGKVFSPLSNIGMEIENIQQAVAGTRRIEEFLAEDEIPLDARAPQESPAEGVLLPSSAAPAVELDRVSFSYDDGVPVISDFSLSVAPGERVTIAGRTGAGKSTLMKLMLGLYLPDGGAVRVLGCAPNLIPARERRRTIGYVEQRFRRVPGDVFDQVALFDDAVSPADVDRALALVGLSGAVARLPRGVHEPCGPTTFSQGQFQLLSIARAIVCDPRVLLLDEITANLDSATERHVLDAIDAASSGRTVVAISHRLTEAVTGRIVHIDAVADAAE
jgi:ATP-binding cassette subfamily B multidrug efflux pump